METRTEGPRLLVIADDLTGANDTGVQFAKRGIPTVVLVQWDNGAIPTGFEVVVVNTESRHVRPDVARDRVRRVAEAGVTAGVQFFFKKTDSTLRGDIGAELAGLMEATGEMSIAFVPAFPEQGRTTRAGMHYVHGIPIAESEFREDPLSPILENEVAKVIQCAGLEISSATVNELGSKSSGCVVVDCSSREELRRIASTLHAQSRLRVAAGSAAFAEELPTHLTLATAERPELKLEPGILIVNGSLNPRALDQISAASETFQKVQMTPATLFDSEARTKFLEDARSLTAGDLLFYSVEQRDEVKNYEIAARKFGVSDSTIHQEVARGVGEVIKELLCFRKVGVLVVFGGDTLVGISRACGWTGFVPLTEIGPGITVAKPVAGSVTVVSKAGGFGDAAVVETISRWIRARYG